MKYSLPLLGVLIMICLLPACQPATGTQQIPPAVTPPPSRQSAIPPDAEKMTPPEDPTPPKLHAEEWLEPVPLPGTVNTAGAEDSPFVSPDGNRLFFFFTPDVRVPAESQLTDGVTGIYVTRLTADGSNSANRLQLQDPGKLALDGCPFFDGNLLWFCSVREGHTGLHWFQAELNGDRAISWQIADFTQTGEVGELHIYQDELFFHSEQKDGRGGRDIWRSQLEDGSWQPAVNLSDVNTEADEGYPFVTADGRELWFTRTYQGTPAIYRSLRINEGWESPQLVISQFAGEPTLDPQGNLYFVHHFFKAAAMLEADIYVAYRR